MSQAERPASVARQSLRVLVIEDVPDLATLTAEFLRDEGLDVQTALSGRDALGLASVFRPELIFCDLNLPDTSGLELVRQLRANPLIEKSYIVILTAMSGLERAYLSQATGVGVDAFISKPITIEDIGTLVEKLTPRDPRG